MSSMEIIPVLDTAQPENEKKRQKKECQICFDLASGCHFGVMACEGCKGFFRRNIQKNAKFVCFYHNECDVYGVKKRKTCQKCRMDACLRQGMNAAMIKKNNLNRNRRSRVTKDQDGRSAHKFSRRYSETYPGSSRVDYNDPSGDTKMETVEGKRPERVFNRDTFNLAKIDKTAKLCGIRHAITSLNPIKEHLRDGSKPVDTRLVDSGIGDDERVVSPNPTETNRSRQSVLRQSDCGKIYIIDTATQERTLDTQSMCYLSNSKPVGSSTATSSDTRYALSVPAKRVQAWTSGSSSSHRRTADVLTTEIFTNLQTTINKVESVCQSCAQYISLSQNDRQSLFQSSIYELVMIYSYFENKPKIVALAKKSSTMMQGLVDALDSAEIKSWSQCKIIMMMSLLSADRVQSRSTTFIEIELIHKLKKDTQLDLQSSMSEITTSGMAGYVNVLLLLPLLREMNEYLISCSTDANGIPIMKERVKIVFS